MRILQLCDKQKPMYRVETGLDCCNVSDRYCSVGQRQKSVLIRNTTNMRPTYSAKVACEKEQAQRSGKQTNKDFMMSLRCQDEGQEVSHSRFCKRFALIHIQLISLILRRLIYRGVFHYKLLTANMYARVTMFEVLQNGEYGKLAYFTNLLLYKY